MSGKGLYTGPGCSQARDFAFARKGSRAEYNLLSLSGGTFKLQSDEEWQELYRLLALDYQDGKPNFMVERKTPVFPLALDIDFKHAHHDLQWLIDKILPATCRGLLKALATECKKVSFMLSTAPTVPCEMAGGQQGLKSGAHVHFQYVKSNEGKLLDVIFNEDRAMAVRKCCIAELSKEHGDGMDWETIVDPSVLKDNGLRMLYQCKATPCADCKKLQHRLEKSAGPCPMGEQLHYRCKCPRCTSISTAMKRSSNEHGCSLGKVINQRVYLPGGQYTYDLPRDRLRLNPAADYSKVPWDPLEMLLLTSVRLPSTDHRPPLNVKVPVVSTYWQNQLASHSRKRKKGEPRTIMLPTAQRSTAGGTDLAASDPKVALVKQMLELPVIKGTYPNAVSDLHRVVRVSDTAIKLFFTTGYCHNHRGAHSSNRTYFFVVSGKVTQHCYDEDCRGYKNVMLATTPDGLFG